MNGNGNEEKRGRVLKCVRRLTFALAALLLAVGSRSAQAALETYTANYGSPSAPLVVSDFGGTSFPFSLSLPQFNPSQGTLEQVVLTLSSTDIAGSQVLNETGTSQSYSGAFADLTVNISGPNMLLTSLSLEAGPFSGVVGAGTHVDAGSSSGAAAASTTDVPSADFASYIGSGMVSLNLSGSALNGTYGGSGPAGLFFGGFADSYGTVEVQYSYAAVPEPGTLFAGLAALGFCFFKLLRWPRSAYA
jgi:hypothetical protein